MAVKDNLSLCGHHMGLGSRAYLALSSPAPHTAPAVQRLLDAGAVLVGSTQLGAMGQKQEPTQSIDYPAPINPRGDGFQSPLGGSCGDPAAVASYAWLDFAIGSDSTVSGRLPAQANGCFSFRPSHGVASAEGMWSGVPEFDTPCIFARELGMLATVTAVWCKLVPRSLHDGKRTLLVFTDADFRPVGNQRQMEIFRDFVHDASTSLQAPVEYLCLGDIWDAKPPTFAHGASLRNYLDDFTAQSTYVLSIWHRISTFCAEHESQSKCRPFLPLPLGTHTWDGAKEVTPDQSKAAWAKLDTYKQWVLDHVLHD